VRYVLTNTMCKISHNHTGWKGTIFLVSNTDFPVDHNGMSCIWLFTEYCSSLVPVLRLAAVVCHSVGGYVLNGESQLTCLPQLLKVWRKSLALRWKVKRNQRYIIRLYLNCKHHWCNDAIVQKNTSWEYNYQLACLCITISKLKLMAAVLSAKLSDCVI